MSSDRLLALVECLFGSNKFARAFNDDVELRTLLWKAGYTKQRSRPNLIKQETTSLCELILCAKLNNQLIDVRSGVALRILFRIYDSDARKPIWDNVEEKILSVSKKITTDYVPETKDIWATSVVLVIRELLHLSDDRVCHVPMSTKKSILKCCCSSRSMQRCTTMCCATS